MKVTSCLDSTLLNSKDYSLSSEEKIFYEENGYFIASSLFSEKECAEMLDLIYSYAEEEYPVIMNLDRKCETVFDIMKTKRIVSILKDLQDNDVAGLMSQVIFKHPGSRYASQAWEPHQDNSYVKSPNGQFLNCLIALESQNPENGSLYLYPASHTKGVFSCEVRENQSQSSADFDSQNPGNAVLSHILSDYKKLDIVMKPGDALFIHGNCIHGSYANTSKTCARSMLQFGYITKGESFLSGKNAQRKEIPLY